MGSQIKSHGHKLCFINEKTKEDIYNSNNFLISLGAIVFLWEFCEEATIYQQRPPVKNLRISPIWLSMKTRLNVILDLKVVFMIFLNNFLSVSIVSDVLKTIITIRDNGDCVTRNQD